MVNVHMFEYLITMLYINLITFKNMFNNYNVCVSRDCR